MNKHLSIGQILLISLFFDMSQQATIESRFIVVCVHGDQKPDEQQTIMTQ